MVTISKIGTAGVVEGAGVEEEEEEVVEVIKETTSRDPTLGITRGGEGSRVEVEVEELDLAGRREPSVGLNIGR